MESAIQTILNAPKKLLQNLLKSMNLFSKKYFEYRTATENYWQVKFDFTEMVNQAFNEHNITIPFRQLDVHIHKGDSLK